MRLQSMCTRCNRNACCIGNRMFIDCTVILTHSSISSGIYSAVFYILVLSKSQELNATSVTDEFNKKNFNAKVNLFEMVEQ